MTSTDKTIREPVDSWHDLTVPMVEEAIGIPRDRWSRQCHAVSLAIVRSGLVKGRVLRGYCDGVEGQHSWIALDTANDAFEREVEILDPTLWSYDDKVKDYLWWGTNLARHRPHGSGRFFDYGCPIGDGKDIVGLNTCGIPGNRILRIMESTGFDYSLRAWSAFFNSGHFAYTAGGASDIIHAACFNTDLCALIPIDIVGNLTSINPDGLYMQGDTLTEAPS